LLTPAVLPSVAPLPVFLSALQQGTGSGGIPFFDRLKPWQALPASPQYLRAQAARRPRRAKKAQRNNA